MILSHILISGSNQINKFLQSTGNGNSDHSFFIFSHILISLSSTFLTERESTDKKGVRRVKSTHLIQPYSW